MPEITLKIEKRRTTVDPRVIKKAVAKALAQSGHLGNTNRVASSSSKAYKKK
jgi:hypothetical protein